jgi:hypothetical protein
MWSSEVNETFTKIVDISARVGFVNANHFHFVALAPGLRQFKPAIRA